MNIADHFISKTSTTRAFADSVDREKYDHVLYDGTVYFYDLPENTNAEDFAAALAVAFDVELEAIEVINWEGVYRADIS